jgi:hypothetical protein
MEKIAVAAPMTDGAAVVAFGRLFERDGPVGRQTEVRQLIE